MINLKSSIVQSDLDTLESNIRGGTQTLETLYDEIETVEHHFHSPGRWFGISGDQSGNNWGILTLSPYRAISGNNTWGADANDEAKVFGSDDTPAVVGKLAYDARRLFIAAVSVDTKFMLRVVWGTGTMADAITAGQCSEFPIQSDTTNPQRSTGTPVEMQMPQLAAGMKLWMQAWNVTDNAWVDFLIGIHEYDELDDA